MTGPVVAVLSYGRAGAISTPALFPGGVIVVPKSQAKEYGRDLAAGWEVVAIPDSDDGNIARKRNAALRLFAGRDLVMLDDDYDYVGRHEARRVIRLDHERIEALIAEGFALMEGVRTVLWGLNVQIDPRFYRPWSPFAMLSPVLGPFMGVSRNRPKDLLFDEDLWLKEDYDFSLRVLHRYHAVLRMNQFHYMVDHLGKAGGVVSSRTMAEEVRQLHRLETRWGSDVVKLRLHRTLNPRIMVPLKGV